MKMSITDFIFKLIIVGDASTGKTSLTHRYLSGIFVDSPRLTIGVDFFSKKIKMDGKRVKLQIWDFGGEEDFRFLLPAYAHYVEIPLITVQYKLWDREMINCNAIHIDGTTLRRIEVKHINRHEEPILSRRW